LKVTVSDKRMSNPVRVTVKGETYDAFFLYEAEGRYVTVSDDPRLLASHEGVMNVLASIEPANIEFLPLETQHPGTLKIESDGHNASINDESLRTVLYPILGEEFDWLRGVSFILAVEGNHPTLTMKISKRDFSQFNQARVLRAMNEIRRRGWRDIFQLEIDFPPPPTVGWEF
jgi:hypothetical protein